MPFQEHFTVITFSLVVIKYYAINMQHFLFALARDINYYYFTTFLEKCSYLEIFPHLVAKTSAT